MFAEANRALALAPDWEGAHHFYGDALARSGWSEAFDFDVERATADQTWDEVVRWAEKRTPSPRALWRRGRFERWAEALDRLGRATPRRPSDNDSPRYPPAS